MIKEAFEKNRLQSPLANIRTPLVTHSRLVKHFRILKK